MDQKSSHHKQDRLLKNQVKQLKSPNWEAIAESLGSKGLKKTAKQCRDRWIHSLNPSLRKEDLTKEEGLKLFELHQEHGPKWKLISQQFTGRTDNFLKNQFFSLLRKALRKICKRLNVPKSSINENCFLWGL